MTELGGRRIQIGSRLIAQKLVPWLVDVPIGEEDCRLGQPRLSLLHLTHQLLPPALVPLVLSRRGLAQCLPRPFERFTEFGKRGDGRLDQRKHVG